MASRMVVAGAVAVLFLSTAAGGMWWHGRAEPDAEATDEILPVPPVPPRIAEGEDYDKCLDMLNTDPDGARDFADAWAPTGGEAALHCRALAEVALGEAEEGADMLDKLAATSHAAPAARAAVYGQAGQAWLMAAAPDHAFASASNAIALNQDDPDLLVDRSIAASSLGHYQNAADDLTHALELDPSREDALVFRAAAWRNLNQLQLAQDDIDRALTEDGDNPDALLERGILRQRRGDPAGARTDWERALSLAPDSATGDLAQQNLALLEAGPERR